MLSEKHIYSLIEKYSKTNAGKAEIAKYIGNRDFIAKPAGGKSYELSEEQMIKIGNDMKDILFKKISSLIKSFRLEDIIVKTPVVQNDQYVVSIGFNEEALKRESLDPVRYPEGVENIVKLFITGYNARASVYGVWKGHGEEEIWSLRHRDPNSFMDDAVEEFNNKYKSVALAELTKDYKTNI